MDKIDNIISTMIRNKQIRMQKSKINNKTKQKIIDKDFELIKHENEIKFILERISYNDCNGYNFPSLNSIRDKLYIAIDFIMENETKINKIIDDIKIIIYKVLTTEFLYSYQKKTNKIYEGDKKMDKEEINEIENLNIGKENEVDYLRAQDVIIKSWVVKERQENKCIVFSCKHPDKEDTIELSGVKLKRYDLVKTVGIWLNYDGDGNIPYNSALAVLMRFLKVTNIKDLKDKSIGTDISSLNNPLLVFKAY